MEAEIVLRRLNQLTRKTEDGCWLWIGYKNSIGHGAIRFEGKMHSVHRVSAVLFLGFDIDSPLQINHKDECPNKHCWNPDHLYIGTQQDNIIDWLRLKGRKRFSHCREGHPIDGENKYLGPDNRPRCRACQKRHQVERRQRNSI